MCTVCDCHLLLSSPCLSFHGWFTVSLYLSSTSHIGVPSSVLFILEIRFGSRG
jgi:hypothetical protein